jgi:hypothetical protein
MVDKVLFIVLLLGLSVGANHIGYCQQKNKISFGKVSLEELKMQYYEPDSSAAAVILSDIGKFDGNTLVFTRHLRVKILKKAGLDWGNWVFNTPTKGDFKVWVFNFSDGQVITDKASRDNIFNEEIVKGFEVYKIFAPNVRVGSVVDITYSYLGIPFEWRFQESIPVVFSDLTVEPSLMVTFSKMYFGFENIEEISPSRWQAHNLPAFKVEPYLRAYSNYITKFEFQVVSFGRPGSPFYVPYSTSWEKIIENLLKSEAFGGMISTSAFLNDIAKEIKQKNLTVEEQINEAFDRIQQHIKWDGTKSIFPINARTSFLKNHSGNSANINLCLVSLLRKIGIEAHPVVLSTRENGMISSHMPMMSKLNYVIAYVNHANHNLLLDATSEDLTPGILPPYCLNGEGLVVRNDTVKWIELDQKYRDIQRQYITIAIDKNLYAKATLVHERREYAFYHWMQANKTYKDDPEVILNNLRKVNSKVNFLTYRVNKIDKSKLSTSETIEVDITEQLVDAGDHLIFIPIVLHPYINNPFSSTSRNYPIDLESQKEFVTSVSTFIPLGLKAETIPESIRLSIPDGSATFTYLAQANDSQLQLMMILKIQRSVYTEAEYEDLKLFFTEIIKKLNEPVVLSKL